MRDLIGVFADLWKIQVGVANYWCRQHEKGLSSNDAGERGSSKKHVEIIYLRIEYPIIEANLHSARP